VTRKSQALHLRDARRFSFDFGVVSGEPTHERVRVLQERRAVDGLAQIHGYFLSSRHRFGLYAQFLASRNNQQSSLGIRVLDGYTQDLLDQSFQNHLARDFFGEFPRPREIELICRTHTLQVALRLRRANGTPVLLRGARPDLRRGPFAIDFTGCRPVASTLPRFRRSRC